jgi:hypothetical protein
MVPIIVREGLEGIRGERATTNVDMDEVNPSADRIHCPPSEIHSIANHF